MKNIRASRQLNKSQTKWTFYFLALLKEGAYIEKQIKIVNNKEFVTYTLQKDFAVTESRKFSNIIYGQLNFEAVKRFVKKGFKVRENKLKSHYEGQTDQFFFSDFII